MSRLPEHMTMSPDQVVPLRMLALEANQERMFDFRLTHLEARRRIDKLEITLVDSF
jgi:hypothetical protein